MSEKQTEAVDRRRFIKRAATVGWATPVILTMLATSAAASNHDCIATGSQCGTDNLAGGCNDVPPGSGSTTNCCAGMSCVPSGDLVTCICQ